MDEGDEIILEITPMGSAQRVTAMHAATLTEVTFQVPAGADTDTIQRHARRLLAYRLARAERGRAPADGRGGRLV